jgi:type IV pilus assembly protein PilY1
MPEGIRAGAYYVYPRANNIYGAGDYANYVVSFDPNDNYAVTRRSSHVNATYYNPQIRYRPWAESDASRFPDANPSCAYHNPYNTGAGCRDLTADNSSENWWRESGGWVWETQTFYPATYYVYDGVGDPDLATSYTQVEVRPGNAPFAGGTNRSDCTNPTACTYDEEMQNFANWYTYYRSRILASRGGVGAAFAQQGTDIRVGFGTINSGWRTVDGVSHRTVREGVRPFEATDRDDFFDSLYGHPMPTSGTPLRRAIDDVGRYYERTDSAGPWGTNPGTNDGLPQLACRQSYTILMTDGYWNGDAASTSAARANVDNQNGPTITGPDGQTYQYTPEHPYEDNWSNTLADVAMYYWNRDLRSDLPNQVAPNPQDEAFWQHMVTFTVGLGVNGTLDPDTDLAGLTDGTLQWPDPTNTEDDDRIDDLWHAALNSRGGYFSARDPDTFSQALNSALINIAGRSASAAAVAASSAYTGGDALAYQARFNSTDWSGELLAFRIEDDGDIGAQQWSASFPGTPTTRDVFTYVPGSGGADFLWAQLSSAQQADLNTDINGVTDTLGPTRVEYLRGNRALELQNGGDFRNRSTIMGDIVSSDPQFAGKENFAYSLIPGEGASYAAFRQSADYQNRSDMVYVGTNGGMVHGFDAETGQEKFAFVPNGVYEHLSGLTSPDYRHRFYVDGAVRVIDAYIGGSWSTVLVGTLGAGGKSVYALDVTQPDSFTENDVLWEFTHPELGYTIGEATIARIRYNNKWVALFGNGYDTASDTARLFIVDLATGQLIKAIDTGVGTGAVPNGLATPIPVDLNGDKVADVAYAGDLYGNMWKFDLSGTSLASLDLAFAGQPLFTACDGGSCTTASRQPVTARPDVAPHPDGGVMVFFGTGKLFEVGDNVVGGSPRTETFYAVWDNGTAATGGQGALQQRLITSQTAEYRQVDQSPINYASQRGWYLDLSDPGERVVEQPVYFAGRIIFVTLIPSANSCEFGGESWLMDLSAFTGRAFNEPVFDTDGDGDVDEDDNADVVGQRDDAARTRATIVQDRDGNIDRLTSRATGEIDSSDAGSLRSIIRRQSWREDR